MPIRAEKACRLSKSLGKQLASQCTRSYNEKRDAKNDVNTNIADAPPIQMGSTRSNIHNAMQLQAITRTETASMGSTRSMHKPTKGGSIGVSNNNTSEEVQSNGKAMVQETIAKGTCTQYPSDGSENNKHDSRRPTAMHVQAITCTTKAQMKTSKAMHKTTSSKQQPAAFESAEECFEDI
jgi:hypothetical protein